MNLSVATVAAALLAVTSVTAQVISFGQCPDFPVVKNFDGNRYLGTWYEYANYFAAFQLFGICVKADYSDEGPGKIGVFNQGINEFTGNPSMAKGSAVLSHPNDPQKPGQLIVNFENQPDFAKSNKTNYNVVDTDYDSYTVIYTCSNKWLFKSEILWVLTRDRSPPKDLVANVYQKIKSVGLDTSRLKKTDQSNCSN